MLPTAKCGVSDRDGAVGSGAELCQDKPATPSVPLAGLAGGNTQLTWRCEIFQWFNPFLRVAFAGLTLQNQIMEHGK